MRALTHVNSTVHIRCVCSDPFCIPGVFAPWKPCTSFLGLEQHIALWTSQGLHNLIPIGLPLIPPRLQCRVWRAASPSPKLRVALPVSELTSANDYRSSIAPRTSTSHNYHCIGYQWMTPIDARVGHSTDLLLLLVPRRPISTLNVLAVKPMLVPRSVQSTILGRSRMSKSFACADGGSLLLTGTVN